MAAVGFPLWPDLDLLPTTAPLIEAVDYVEVAPETLWGPGGAPNGYHQIAQTLAQAGTPMVAHGVALDPASTDIVRRRRWLENLARDARALGFRWVSDHLGTTHVDGEPVALPLPAPASFDRLTHTLDQLAAATGAPAAVENTAWYAYPSDALDEPARLTQALGDQHHLVLDLHNLWTNSINLGFDPMQWLERAPLSRVIELHISGGTWAPPAWTGGTTLRLDSHDGPVPDEVWQLLEDVAPRCPALRGATLERIEGPIPDHAVQRLLSELDRLRTLVAPLGQPLGPPAAPPEVLPDLPPPTERTPGELAMDQALASLTRTPSAAPGEQVAHRLILKLRFGRLMRGSREAEQWFDNDPAAFVSAFQHFHAQTRCAETPWDEAATWRAFRAGRGGG